MGSNRMEWSTCVLSTLLACGGFGNAPPTTSPEVDELGVFNALNGYTYLRRGAGATTFHLPEAGGFPCAGDFDGDGFDSVAVYHYTEATFFVQNENASDAPIGTIAFGNAKDIPVCGDFDGDGVDSIGVYNPVT